MKKSGIYYVNRHSCFLLQYHLVLVTRYRREVLTGAIRDRMLDLLEEYFARQEVPLLAKEVCADHIHALFDASPDMRLSGFINVLKSWTSRKVRSEFPEQINKFYWKPVFWSKSYFIATESGRSEIAVRTYIGRQNING